MQNHLRTMQGEMTTVIIMRLLHNSDNYLFFMVLVWRAPSRPQNDVGNH